VIGIVGAGNFTKMTMLPVLKGAKLKYIVSAGGVNGTALAKKYNIAKSTTDYQELLQDEEVDTVIITTRHNLHAPMVISALTANKNVFVEKPLALTEIELTKIITAYKQSNKTLTVGFNRRFSPHIVKIKELVDEQSPKNIIATMNAGYIPANVWVHDMEVGGGRIIGEACHFIDLITYISGSKVKSVFMSALGTNPNENTDNVSIMLKYQNGDHAVINYFSNGSKAYSKERLEIYAEEKTLILDNFRTLKGFGTKGFSSMKTKLDKGHKTQFKLLVERAKDGGTALIPFEELINTTRTSFAAITSLKTGKWVNV
jgi:predicted dehydrogenase